MRATIQLCTFNRAPLLERVLDACFEQTVADNEYEVVLVNDGSSDDTPAVIERARKHASCNFSVIDQPNSGLARGRNVGIARASGERIIFIDDDVLPLPDFVEEHLRSHELDPQAIVRGGAINVESFERLPVPIWRIRDYSGNYFWTTNVSVPLATIREVGGFNESFAEYGWEDIDVGLRLRFRGVRARFNPRALVYHYKPQPDSDSVAKMLRQARAQARTAVQLAHLHPHWRTYLATGLTAPQRWLHAWNRSLGLPRRAESVLENMSSKRALSPRELRAARRLVTETYYEELERALRASRTRA
jgi:GT2 family glycosyltransferase